MLPSESTYDGEHTKHRTLDQKAEGRCFEPVLLRTVAEKLPYGSVAMYASTAVMLLSRSLVAYLKLCSPCE